MLARRSVRKFRKDDVPRELLERVVTAAARAPMGVPPWEVGVVVLHGRDKVRELAFDAAEALGLGTKMIGCVLPPLARKRNLLRKYGLPDGHVPKIVLILGWPATHYRKAIRCRFASVRYY